MLKLKGRLDRLERKCASRLQAIRCDVCRKWTARIQTIDVDGSITVDTPEVPEHCPSCGWTPVLVNIEIVEDWRRVGKHGIR